MMILFLEGIWTRMVNVSDRLFFRLIALLVLFLLGLLVYRGWEFFKDWQEERKKGGKH